MYVNILLKTNFTHIVLLSHYTQTLFLLKSVGYTLYLLNIIKQIVYGGKTPNLKCLPATNELPRSSSQGILVCFDKIQICKQTLTICV